VTDIQPVGAFNLIRGRLAILGQRITFDEGRVTLVGDLDPFLDFIARTESDDITVFITVRGRVSDPEIAFSSQPQLPQDEVLARLIFNRGINDLSALQIAQLAAAAAELAGGSNTSLVGSLRDATGLDDLDIVTDSEGNAAVRAGRYIQDNVYLGVEAGAGGTTRGTINLDITEDLKARGAVGSDGESSLGLFYERDY
jgi:translocation and assembly module TamB